jgi:hypothetical protein
LHWRLWLTSLLYEEQQFAKIVLFMEGAGMHSTCFTPSIFSLVSLELYVVVIYGEDLINLWYVSFSV